MTSAHVTSINLTVKPTLSSVLVDTTRDALMIIKGCIDGVVPCIPGRPPERERQFVIASGNVFVYEESLSGIKRWTDSISWSPSRAFTNMLVYREVKNKFKPGSRKVLKKSKVNHRRSPYSQPSSSEGVELSSIPSSGGPSNQETSLGMDPLLEELDPERRKHVVGSLTDSYEFRPAGLCKKTLSINYDDRVYHLVGYYVIRDVVDGTLKRPSDEYPELKQVDIQDILDQNAYKFDIDSSGYYSSNPVKGDDENFRHGASRQRRDYSAGYDSPSSDIDVGFQSMNISNLEQTDHVERQLPPLFPQDDGYQFSANNEWPTYFPARNQFSQQQQQNLSFSQQHYPPSHQQQLPGAGGESNFFLSQQQYPHSIVSNQQPRSIPDDPAFVFDPNTQYARPTNMEPSIPNLSSSTNRGIGIDLSQYRIVRKDENEGDNAQGNPHRQGATQQTSLGPNIPWTQVLTTPPNPQPTVEEDQEFPPHPSQYHPQYHPW